MAASRKLKATARRSSRSSSLENNWKSIIKGSPSFKKLMAVTLQLHFKKDCSADVFLGIL